MSKNEQYAEFLRNLAANGPAGSDKICGTCGLFDYVFHVELYDLLPDHVYTDWPYFSGNRGYPIPDLETKQYPARMYHRTGLKWAGEYGRLRRDWCLHLANYFEELDNE